MTFLVYGAYGYTGELVAREAVARDLDPVLGGRRPAPLDDLASELDCDRRAFDVADATANLGDVDCVLNCAGPFVETAAPMVDACLATGTDYLDVTGEIEVFEALAARDDEASAADVTLLPGVGFDVVPTDCLAAHLAERLPEATHLRLGFDALGSVSPGTAATAVDSLGEGGAVRRNGRIESVPSAWKSRRIDFGTGARTAVTIPWGDVSTAYYTTGIGNIGVYVGMPPGVVTALRASRPLEPLLSLPLVKRPLQSLVRLTASGPDERERERTDCRVWGEARVVSEQGIERRAVSRLRTPNTYALTVDSALAAVDRTLDGQAPAGFTTPAGAFGADFVFDVEGCDDFADDPITP
ncbi:saccharopine dehydrogenase family protein [Halorarius litoreus]|uniref:saccharopine dehydrogenase family protein n=1 Tax=Halorarius litoreus TaxID=2962676 RepID=UPI0020CE4188|nr:saccharopine dehydrogenase NADP-binding domain-containing protein [Halorarius litoreus]